MNPTVKVRRTRPSSDLPLPAYQTALAAGMDLHADLDADLKLESLERFEGHLLNWYDTRTLAPLPPAYISTVDSGNLAGALLTLSVALSQMAGAKGPSVKGPLGPGVAERLTDLASRAAALFADHRV